MPRLAEAQRPPKRDYEIPDMSSRGEKVRVSYSELATFRDCPLKWQLAYYWRLEHPTKDIRLDRGSAWHGMLEAHYIAIQHGAGKAEARKAAVDALNDYSRTVTGGLPDAEFETLTWMYDDYVRIYKSDAQYVVLDTEQDFTFPMPVEGAPGLVIVGKIDLETADADDGTRRVWDHKSASGRDVSKDGFVSEMLLEDQFILYAAAKRMAGEPVASVVYNAARTDKLKRAMLDVERFNRVSIPYTDPALDEVWADNIRAATALVAMWNDPERVYSVPNPKQCGWKCQFQRTHIESRSTGRPIVEVALDYGMQFKPQPGSTAEAELDAVEANDEAEQW